MKPKLEQLPTTIGAARMELSAILRNEWLIRMSVDEDHRIEVQILYWIPGAYSIEEQVWIGFRVAEVSFLQLSRDDGRITSCQSFRQTDAESVCFLTERLILAMAFREENESEAMKYLRACLFDAVFGQDPNQPCAT